LLVQHFVLVEHLQTHRVVLEVDVAVPLHLSQPARCEPGVRTDRIDVEVDADRGALRGPCPHLEVTARRIGSRVLARSRADAGLHPYCGRQPLPELQVGLASGV
jgi:hypothetical protein